jgi:hypothetical protein
MDQKQREFIDDLDALIRKTERRPAFRGKTKAVAALKRVRALAVFH